MLWLIPIGIVAYVIADAFFDVSDKISKWVRGAWGGARGVFARKDKNSPAQAAAVVTEESKSANRLQTESDQARKPINWTRALTNILGFFLRYWQPIVLVILALVIISAFRGCSLPFDGKSKDALRLERELAEARAETQEQLRQRDEAIAAIRINTAREIAQIRLESQRGHDEIAAATPEHEEPLDAGLVAAWRSSLDRLCVPRANGDRSDTCGP